MLMDRAGLTQEELAKLVRAPIVRDQLRARPAVAGSACSERLRIVEAL
jgi:hypothetical protein